MFEYLKEFINTEVKYEELFDKDTASLSEAIRFQLASYINYILQNGYLNSEKNRLTNKLNSILLISPIDQKKILLEELINSKLKIPETINTLLKQNEPLILSLIIENYQYLSDLELIHICDRNKSPVLLHALAKRTTISETLSDYIVAKGDEHVIYTLLQNKVITTISEDLYSELTKKYTTNIKITTLLKAKMGKPKANTPEKLRNSTHHREQHLNSGDVLVIKFSNPTKIPKYFEFKVIQGNTSLLNSTIDNLYMKNKLNEILIATFLTKGDLYSFIYSIAILSDVPFKSALTIITSKFITAEFRELLNSVAFSQLMIDTIICLLSLISEATLDGEFFSEEFAKKINSKLNLVVTDNEILNTLRYLLTLANNN